MWMLLVGLSWADQAHRITDPMQRRAFVADEAGILDAAAELRMNGLLGALHQDLGVEVVVVTVPNVEEGTPKQLTTQLFELWALGDAEANTGMLVLLAVRERRIEMEPGYGLEPVMTDAWLGTLQRQKMVPFLREERWAEGLESGLAVVDAQLRLKADQVLVGAPAPTWWQGMVSGFLAMPWVSRIAAVVVSFVMFWAFVVSPIKRRFFLTAKEREELASLPPGTSAQERRARRQEILRRSERYQTGHSGGSSGSAPRSRGGRSGGGGAGSSF